MLTGVALIAISSSLAALLQHETNPKKRSPRHPTTRRSPERMSQEDGTGAALRVLERLA